MLADLTREEIIALAEYHHAFEGVSIDDNNIGNIARDIFRAIVADLLARGIIRSAQEMEIASQALVRTGLVIQQSGAIGGAMKGGTVYVPSDRLNDLIKLIRVGDVLVEPER
jgi:hypothetical protein